MKFTTFLSLALHALLICQFNPLFSMKRKRESISPNPAKQQKSSFNCSLINEYSKEKNKETDRCTNNNQAGFKTEKKLESHLLMFHHACPKCPEGSDKVHATLDDLSDHLKSVHNQETYTCSYCNNYMVYLEKKYNLVSHRNNCISNKISRFALPPERTSNLRSTNHKQTQQNQQAPDHRQPIQNQKGAAADQPQDKSTTLNWINYDPAYPKQKHSHKKDPTGENFKNFTFNFTFNTDRVTEIPKNNPYSNSDSQQISHLQVPTHQNQATNHTQNAIPLVAYDTNQNSQFPLFLSNPFEYGHLTPQQNPHVNHNNYNITNYNITNYNITNYNVQDSAIKNIPPNYPTTTMTPTTIQTESCGIEMPPFDSVPPEFYLNFSHLPGAGVTIQSMPSTLVACSSCQKKFTSHQDMKKHAVSAHLECPQLECTYRDATASGLMVHTTEKHFHEHVSIFPCIHCNAFAATDIQEKNAHRQSCSLTPRYSYGNN